MPTCSAPGEGRHAACAVVEGHALPALPAQLLFEVILTQAPADSELLLLSAVSAVVEALADPRSKENTTKRLRWRCRDFGVCVAVLQSHCYSKRNTSSLYRQKDQSARGARETRSMESRFFEFGSYIGESHTR